jgi:sugar lactone lactonase YvrE
MTGKADWRIDVNAADRVGEGPLWMAEESSLYWVDVLGQAVNRLSLIDGSLQRWPMPEMTGFIIPRRNRRDFIVGLQSGFHILGLEPFRLELLGDPEAQLPDNRLNDAKTDARGRLWAGTMPVDGDTPDGALYRLDSDHRWHMLDTGYCVTNGPAFSPKQDYLYVADSPQKLVYRFELDDAGNLHNKLTFISFPDDWGVPDGMTIDATGHLWIAHWDGGRVSRFDPDGRLDHATFLPASRITSCAFGGTSLDRLFVTSAREGREAEPLAGALFEIETSARGILPGAYAG